jgi:hypothetical protein
MNSNKNFIESLLEKCETNILDYNKSKTFQKNKIPIPLSRIALPNTRYNWYFDDSEENFLERPHPEYLNGFNYKFNNYGYRCDDFDLENDKYKILTIGCSISFGFGLPYEETYSYILCKKLSEKYNIDIKNYNLSHSGVSSDYISRLLFQTIDIIKPNYVILFFPTFNRLEHENIPIHATLPDSFSRHFENDNASRLIKKIEMYLDLLDDSNYCFLNFVKNFNFIDEILKRRNSKWFWMCWDKSIKNVLCKKDFLKNLENYISLENSNLSESFITDVVRELEHKPKQDKNILARDWAHPGKDFNQFFADYLYDKITKENVFENAL